MKNTTKDDIRISIIEYLKFELELEVKKAFKDKTPTQKSIDSKREKLKPNFEFQTWLSSLKESLEFMQNHNLSLATHISKGIHSAVRSDNLIINRVANDDSLDFSSSIDVPNPKLDANTNNTGSHAGHLKIIVNFLNVEILQGRLYTLIKDNNLAIQAFFEQYLNVDFCEYLSDLLNFEIIIPITDGRNKQTLFPINDETYHCIVPLFPSSLTQHVHQEINNIKYSELSKTSRKLKFSKEHATETALAYRDILGLAVVKLGGENAQNVSRLNNVQGGFHYLLPSLPPQVNFTDDTFKPSKFAKSIFSKSLANKVSPILQDVYKVVESKTNPYTVRDARKKAMDEILNRLFEFAGYMRNELVAGWTIDSALDDVEAFWLDPKRADLPEQEEWKLKREDPNNKWDKEIIHSFARWMNTLLQAKFEEIRTDFADPEHNEWEREIEAMKSAYERAGKGVFL